MLMLCYVLLWQTLMYIYQYNEALTSHIRPALVSLITGDLQT